jgi:hypothetical protein
MTVPDTRSGAIGVAEPYAKPSHKDALRAIRNLLVGQQTNPLEGFERVITYKYRGEPIDPADLAREIVWKKREAIQDAQFVRAGDSTRVDPIADDAALRAEIEAILQAAGVTE